LYTTSENVPWSLTNADHYRHATASSHPERAEKPGHRRSNPQGLSCTTPFFINQLCHKATSGAKYFLADDCTPFQIKAVLELNAKEIPASVPSDFVVHLVRQA
jgi:hypothetical protein